MNDDLTAFLQRLVWAFMPAAARAGDRALTWLIARLPWGSHSVHEAWLEGYKLGLREGRRR